MTTGEVVLIVIMVAQLLTIAGILWFHNSQTRDWREERAYLLNATMARSLPELRGPIPTENHGVGRDPFADLEGYEAQVGL